MASDKSWKKIFKDHKIDEHDFDESPFLLPANKIKKSCQGFKDVAKKEVRILCKQDTRESRPKVFKDKELFLLPIRNGIYNIIKGEGYVDIPKIESEVIEYETKLDFDLDTSKIGDSEMQHLDYAYATSIIRTFMDDDSLVLTIRGRKYTPSFEFKVGEQIIKVESVQTEVDAGYEGKEQVVLVEAKSSGTSNTIIRLLYYPYRQWQSHIDKKVYTLFFEKDEKENAYLIWQFRFNNINDYNSIELVKSKRYKIK